MKHHRRRTILGIGIDNVDMGQAVQQCLGLVEKGRQKGKSHYVATVNVDFICNCLSWELGRASDPELLQALRRADLVTADGMPIVWLCSLLGVPLKGRVTGADLLLHLSKVAATEGKSIFFLGGKPENTEAAVLRLQKDFPYIDIRGFACPEISMEGKPLRTIEQEDRQVLDEIHEANPDILFLGLGNPKQELWYSRVKHRLRIPLAIGVGGAFNFLAGSVQRAPGWVQNSGFEWCWRLWNEPSRLAGRYICGFIKFSRLALSALWERSFKRTLSKSSAFRLEGFELFPGHDGALLKIEEEIPPHAVYNLYVQVKGQLAKGSVLVDFSDLRSLNLEVLSVLVALKEEANRLGRGFVGFGLNEGIIRFLKTHYFWDFFAPYTFPSRDEAEWHQNPRSSTYHLERSRQVQALCLSGVWDAATVWKRSQEIYGTLELEHAVVDLSDRCLLDQRGMSFLVKLKERVNQMGKELILSVSRASCKIPAGKWQQL